jgi:hypothetical protein
MKKIIFLLLIVGQILLSNAQDKVYIDANYSAVPPTGWSVLDDQGGSTTTNNWSHSAYPIVYSDVVAQDEWIKSPTISLTATFGYRVSFNYMASAYDANENLYLIVSTDNGATWSTDYPADNIWDKNSYYGGPSEYWLNSGYIYLSSYAAGGNVDIKIGFVYQTDGSVTDGYFALDNVLVEEDNGGGYAQLAIYRFENGITGSPAWTKTNGAGSTQHFIDYNVAKVEDDPALYQDEWLITNDIVIDDNALTDVTVAVDWFAYNNTAGNGAYIYYSTDNGANYYYWDDISANSGNSTTTNQIVNYSTNVNNFKGETVRFAIRFVSNGTADIFINRFVVDQIFVAGSVNADAQITLQPYDMVLYPTNAKYNGDFKEGFWQVEPENWTTSGTNVGVDWYRTGWISNHDYSAQIDTVGANEAAMNETLTSETITVSYPSVGASYLLSFDWRTETNLNAGTNTDPLMGGSVDYDFADIKMEIRTNGGTWTQIWQEDDQAVLDATTLTTSDGYHNSWSGFQYYLDNPGLWFTAVLDLNSYITPATISLEIRVNYTGDGMYGGYFNIDNLYVLQTQNPEFDFEAAEPFSASSSFLTNYDRIPITQITNPYQLGAVITNNGIASFSNNNLFAYVNENYAGEETFGYRVLTSALLPANTTNYITVDNLSSTFTGGMNFTEGLHYGLRYAASDLNGNAFNESLSFDVTSTEFRKNTGGADGYDITTDYVTGGIGTLFEFKNDDVIDQISVLLGDVHNTSDFNLSVIKVTSPSATTGTLIYNSPLIRMTSDYSTYYFSDDLNIAAGYYIFMFNQLDDYNLNIAYDDDTYTDGVVYRGNASNIYTNTSEVAELMVSVYVKQNELPEITTSLTNDEKVLFADEAVELIFAATDANGDSLTWTMDAATPAWLTDWIVFTDNGDGTATLSGTPTTGHLGTSNILISVNDGRGGSDSYSFTLKVASQTAAFNPDYTELFDGSNSTVPVNWVTLNDQLETGSDYHWSLYSNRMNIFGDDNEDQDEWIISPPIYLANTAKSLDTSYRLEFDWEVYNFSYFCLGLPGVLGSAGNGGYNYADVTLMVSIDNGLTWSAPIWKEDDPELVAPVTEGIDGGEKWGYSNNTTYTSKIELSAYVGETVLFAFRYQGKSADYWQNSFAINNFKVLRNNQVDISVITFRDYQYLPERQVDQVNGVKFHAYIINQGITVPVGATYTLKLPEVGYEETFDLDASFFATGDTQMVEYTFYPQANVNQWYYFTTSVDADNNATSGMTSHQEDIYIHPYLMYLEYSANVEERSFGYYDGLGVGYELTNADHLYRIYGYFGSSTLYGTPLSISIIKVNDFGDTSGELIATIDDNGGSPLYVYGSGSYYFYPSNDQDYNENLYLEAGKYIVMFNQLDDDYPIYLYKTNTTYHFNKYFRGNFSEIYWDDYDQGHLYTNLYFDSNDAPRFVDENENTINTYTAEVLVGESETFAIYAADYDEFDVLGFDQVTDPSFLAPAWLSFTFDADTAFMTIAATAPAGQYPAQLKVGDGVDTTTLSITININGPQYMADEFYEPFNGWTENYPKITTADNTWTLKKGVNSDSSNDWYYYSSDTRISNDNSNYQNEWLISPYVYFNAPANDTTYWLNFYWYIEDVTKMLGGTKDVIGSGDEFNDFNYADLRVKISTDGGNTWTLLWQEDDEILVEAANPDIIYPYSSNYYYNKNFSKIDITSYAGQPLLLGFQYEGLGACSVGLDGIEVERVDPYVDLEITRYDVLPYYMPIKQVKDIDVKFTVTNWGTAPSDATTIAAQVTNSGGDLNPAYEETMQMDPLAGGASMEYTFPTAHATYGEYNWNYNFYFDIYAPYYVNNSYSSYVSNNFYGYDHGSVNGSIYSEPGQGLGQVFRIYEEDLMTQVYLYSYAYNYLVINVVKLTDADATSGDLIYTSSPMYAYYGWTYLDIEDVTLEPGYYAVFVTDSEENESFPIGYNSYTGVNAGTYIQGDATGFEVVEQARYLDFRLVFDNSAPYFANSEGNSISLSDETAMVGIEFNTLVRAIDEDEDDIPVVEGLTLPTWLTVKDTNGFYLLTGTPTIADLGENLVVLRATDGTTYDEDDFVITVEENPAPEFITAPVLNAFQGKSYSYQATAVDKFADVVTLTATLPSWLTVTGSGSSITISGTPTASNIGEFAVKIDATDDHGMTSEQLFTIVVVANSVPEFVSTPVTTGNIGAEYTYYIAANDANSSDVITITAPTRPTWLTLSATGNGRATLIGTPTAGGTFNVVLVATDAIGATATQSYSIVVESNAAPVFTSTAVTSATEDVLYTYVISTTDADGDYMYFDAKVIPNWLVLTVTGNGKATLQGIPAQQYVGNNSVSLAVGDGTNKTEQNFTIAVAEVNDAPMIVSPSIDAVAAGNTYQYLVEGFDEEGATLEFTAQLPAWLALTDYNTGKALISGIATTENIGDYEITVLVTDGNSESEQVFNLTVSGVTDIDGSENEAISIYPNPTSGKFTLTHSEGATIMVFNITGEMVYHAQNASLSEEIDLTGFNEGNYAVKVILNDKVVNKTISIIK